MRTLGSAGLVLVVVLSLILGALPVAAAGGEAGDFPNRTFYVEKSVRNAPRESTYRTAIVPPSAGEWAVRLDDVGGSAVVVQVFRADGGIEQLEGSSRLTKVGQTSSPVRLLAGLTYVAVFTPYGKAGVSVLSEQFDPAIPPVACFTVSPDPPLAGATLVLDATCSTDPDGSIRSYRWDFGDGAAATGAVTTHAYASEGTYVVMMTVIDDDRLAGTASQTLVVKRAGFVGPFEDHGYDADGDGRFDWIVLNVGLYFAEPTYATIYGTLYGPDPGPNGSLFLTAEYSFYYYAAGWYGSGLRFLGYQINATGVDGPYTVDLVLFDSSRWVQIDTATYVTQPYRHTDFEEVPATFRSPHQDEGIDTDGDGRFDRLHVRAEVDVLVPGTYTVSASLNAPSPNGTYTIPIAVSSETAYLGAGAKEVLVSFEGFTIRFSGYDGPYEVQLFLYGNGSFLDADTHVTAAYRYLAFDGYGGLLAPPHVDEGRDLDGDGKYDVLALLVSVDVDRPGPFEVSGQLASGDGTMPIAWGHAYEWLPSGRATLVLTFSGLQIRMSGVDGPYRIHLTLWGQRIYEYGILDEGDHTTAAYSHEAFEDLPAELAPPFTDSVLDTDGDGLYNYLVIEIRIDVRDAGDYQLYGRILEANGTYGNVSSAGNVTRLEPGLQEVRLGFLGFQLNRTGISGPYTVLVELLRVSAGWMYLGNATHTTAAYAARSFDGPPATIEPGIADFGWDVDGYGLYNFLVLKVPVRMEEPGGITLSVSLEANGTWGGYYLSASNTTYLVRGLHVVWILFSGSELSRIGAMGPFRTYLYLLNPQYVVYDEASYVTGAYEGADFDLTRAGFVRPYSDEGVDGDEDGMYDWLVVTIRIFSEFPAALYAQGVLTDAGGRLGTVATAYSTLRPGVTSVELAFSGIRIRQSGADGPYNVTIYVSSPWYFEGFDTYTTAPYFAAQFEPPSIRFVPPHADRGVDSDGDGLYDWLVVGVNVEVSDPGAYRLEGVLGGFVLASNGSYLEAGLQTIELAFDGLSIGLSRLDGPYGVDLSLYDPHAGGWWMDRYVTSLYLASQFEGPPATFVDPFSDRAVDTDGDGRANLLVVSVGLAVREPVDLFLFGTLSAGWQSVYVQSRVSFDVGLAAADFAFDGAAIGATGAAGPYRVVLEMFDTVSGRRLDVRDYLTQPYNVSIWEYIARLLPPFLDRGIDLDEDGLHDALEVEVGVSVDHASTYQVSGALYSPYGGRLWTMARTVLDASDGEYRVAIRFDGFAIRSSETDGPYIVQLYLDDLATGSSLDREALYLANYSYLDFDGPPAAFGSEHRDFGLDADGDGLYDYLVIAVAVNVTSPADLIVEATAYLNATSGSFWVRSVNATFLEPGLHEVWLPIDGVALRIAGINGTLPVILELFANGTWMQYSSHAYETAAYGWWQFEEPPVAFVGSPADRGEDVDGDGLFDSLVIGVPLQVQEEHEYQLNVYLDAGSFSYLVVTNVPTLAPGDYVMEARIDGPTLYAIGLDGPYRLIVTLTWFVGFSNWTLIQEYYSAPYLHTMFDPTPPQAPAEVVLAAALPASVEAAPREDRV